MENIKIYSFDGVQMMHIADFAKATHRAIQSLRNLIENGNVVRKMKFFRDRSRLMIPVTELTGYPFVRPGHSEFKRAIHHYELNEETQSYELVLCPQCSFGEMCPERKAAEDLVMPIGDA